MLKGVADRLDEWMGSRTYRGIWLLCLQLYTIFVGTFFLTGLIVKIIYVVLLFGISFQVFNAYCHKERTLLPFRGLLKIHLGAYSWVVFGYFVFGFFPTLWELRDFHWGRDRVYANAQHIVSNFTTILIILTLTALLRKIDRSTNEAIRKLIDDTVVDMSLLQGVQANAILLFTLNYCISGSENPLDWVTWISVLFMACSNYYLINGACYFFLFVTTRKSLTRKEFPTGPLLCCLLFISCYAYLPAFSSNINQSVGLIVVVFILLYFAGLAVLVFYFSHKLDTAYYWRPLIFFSVCVLIFAFIALLIVRGNFLIWRPLENTSLQASVLALVGVLLTLFTTVIITIGEWRVLNRSGRTE